MTLEYNDRIINKLIMLFHSPILITLFFSFFYIFVIVITITIISTIVVIIIIIIIIIISIIITIISICNCSNCRKQTWRRKCTKNIPENYDISKTTKNTFC